MGIIWRLPELLAARGLSLEELDGLDAHGLDETWLSDQPPADMRVSALIALSEALGCQPGDLLAIEAEDPAVLAERNLANDLFYQSFLAHRAALDQPDE